MKLSANYILFGILLLIASSKLLAQQNGLDNIKKLTAVYRYDEALFTVNQFISKDSLNVELFLAKGKIQTSLFQYAQATKTYEKAYLLDTLNVAALNELASANRNAGNNDGTIFYLKKLLSIDPQNRYFTILLANSFVEADNFLAAKKYYFKSYKIDTTDAFVVKKIARCYEELNELDSAIFYYRKATLINALDFSSITRLANIFISQKEYAHALESTEKYRMLDSVNISMKKLSGYIQYLLKEYEKSETLLLQCYQNGEMTKFVSKYLALSFYKQEKFLDAIRYFKIVLAMDSVDSETSFYLGVSYTRSHFQEQGMYYLEKTLRLINPSPSFLSLVYSEIAGNYVSNNDVIKAGNYYKMAVDASPENSTNVFKLAYHYDYIMKNKSLAEKYYNQYMGLKSDENILGYEEHVKQRLQKLKKGTFEKLRERPMEIRVYSHKFLSDFMHEQRTVWMGLPEKYSSKDTAISCLYILDGGENTVIDIIKITDSLTRKNLIPKMIVIGIQNTQRNRDMNPVETSTCKNPGAELFYKYIHHELIPFVTENYPVSEEKILYGENMATNFITYSAINNRAQFNSYISTDFTANESQNYFSEQLNNQQTDSVLQGKFFFSALHRNSENFEKTRADFDTFLSQMKKSANNQLKTFIQLYDSEKQLEKNALSDGLQLYFKKK